MFGNDYVKVFFALSWQANQVNVHCATCSSWFEDTVLSDYYF